MDNKLKIVNCLGKNPHETPTMHELSSHLKIPYASFYRTIEEIKDLLIINKIGKCKTLGLKYNDITIAYLAISSYEEKKQFLKEKPLIKKIHDELNTVDIVILFGSYAKRTEKKDSDIDLLIINKTGNKSISFSRYELLFKKRINPVFITKAEFRKMLKASEENIAKQALKQHIILNSPLEFWKNAIR